MAPASRKGLGVGAERPCVSTTVTVQTSRPGFLILKCFLAPLSLRVYSVLDLILQFHICFPQPHSVRPVQKVHTFGKRANSIKRDPNSPVIMRGWLYKKDSSGLKLWKRRWFVLSNYCLFYYRDSREEMVLGSIPLPSYEIRTAFSKEKKNRCQGLSNLLRSTTNLTLCCSLSQAEHPGMRTYYFSADTQLDMNSWIRAMNQSAVMLTDLSLKPC
uniref:PH domain-containing protein n=1 Tax=Varanus komodoensis TaxID=61221 RepID=A0A8D2LJX9_VARKO